MQQPVVPNVDALFETIYQELKKTASQIRHRYSEHALQTTQLVHELYLRLKQGADDRFPSKAQFFAYAARAMRSIIIDNARSRLSRVERETKQFELAELLADQTLSPELAILLDRALVALSKVDARAARVVEQHFYLGLSLPEIAEHQELSVRTIDRDWRFARAFLRTELDGMQAAV
jgi:RNA polymerase sigma factor (TIGR02999 family)